MSTENTFLNPKTKRSQKRYCMIPNGVRATFLEGVLIKKLSISEVVHIQFLLIKYYIIGLKRIWLEIINSKEHFASF